MRRRIPLATALCLLWSSAGLAAKPPCESPQEAEAASDVLMVQLDTDAGPIRLGLLPGVAPDTVANFLDYVQRGAYDDTFIHRAVPGFVIQLGGYRYQAGAYMHIATTGTVENEFCLSNVRGTVAMAKRAGDPDSATSEWFINLNDNTFLDESNGGFTVFGWLLDEEGEPIREAETSLGVPDVIDTGPRTDGRFSLEVDNRETFKDLPLITELAEDPTLYGCFSTEHIGHLVNPEGTAIEIDPRTGGPVWVSRACTDSGAGRLPTAPILACDPAQGRIVALYDLELDYYMSDDTQTRILTQRITCDELAQSEESFAWRKAHLAPQVPDHLVKINSATVVPEPESWLLRLPSVATLALLRRRRGGRPPRIGPNDDAKGPGRHAEGAPPSRPSMCRAESPRL